MITRRGIEDVRYIADFAFSRSIILSCNGSSLASSSSKKRGNKSGKELTQTRNPRVVGHDVYLSRWVGKSQETAWNNRDGVFLVVDVGEVFVSVDPIGEGWVTDLDNPDRGISILFPPFEEENSTYPRHTIHHAHKGRPRR
jgi:hypothetical protein